MAKTNHMKNLFAITPGRKPFTVHLSGKANKVLAVEKGMLRISEHFKFNLDDTDELHKCKQVMDQVLVCCQQSGKRYDDTDEFEEAFQLFRKSHTFN